ncbi:MAG TPA: hypothetical protein VK781_04100 [Solirubrobacteraceae bacterium]|nr:hypothetical protein [Solirubrobacteraceae bacterium]
MEGTALRNRRRSISVALACALTLVSALALSAPSFAGFTYPFERQLTPSAGSFGQLDAGSVAVNDFNGATYVADSSTGTVNIFETATGAQVGVWNGSATTTPPLGAPGGSFGGGAVSVAANNGTGAVYVLDSTDKVVDVLESDGEFRCRITGRKPASTEEQEQECNGAVGSETVAKGFGTTIGLTVDQATGEVYVLDPENEAVDVFGAGGEYLPTRSFSLSSIPGGFSGATNTRSIAVDDFNKDVYVADSGNDLLYEFEGSGKYVTTWTGGECQAGSVADAPGSTVCATPLGSFGKGFISVAADNASGRVYVTVAAEQVQTDAFSTTGVYRGQFNHGFIEPYGTAVDQANGGVYVSNNRPGLVDVFAALVVPGVISEGPTGLAPREATLNGQVDPEGLPLTGCRFEYGTGTSYGQVAECVPSYREVLADHGMHPVTARLNLESGTTYHYRLVAANANAENTDEPPGDVEFTTPGARMVADSVSDVSSTSATFEATIDPDNTPASYFFEYGTHSVAGCTPSSCTTLPAAPGESIGAGSAPVEVPRQHVQSLESGKTYYYRVVALSEIGGKQVELPGAEHAFTTQGSDAFALPDDRQWQLVTPADKHGARPEADYVAEDALQAAANGNALTYVTNAPTESDPQGFQDYMQVLSWRDGSGWRSRDLEIPHSEAPGLGGGGLGGGQEYRLFSNDLSLAGLQPFGAFDPSLSEEASEQTSYLRRDFAGSGVETPCSEDCFVPLVRAGNVPAGVHFSTTGECQKNPSTFLAIAYCGPNFRGGNGDLSDVVLSSEVALTQTPVEVGRGDGALYEWSDGALKLVSVPSGLSVGVEGYLGSARTPIVGRSARAVSTDGSRVVWHTSGAAQEHLYVTDTAAERPVSVQVDVGPDGEQLSGEPTFQAANTEDTLVWFTDGESLYEFDVEDDRTELLASEDASEGSSSMSVLGVSEGGSWAYFVARSAVAAGAIQGQPNLYARHDGVTRLVATLAPSVGNSDPGDSPDWEEGGWAYQGTVRVSPNGEWLAFMSERALTGYDNRDASTERPAEEVYLYHAPENLEAGARSLTCVSCDPSGGRPVGQAGIEKGIASLGLGSEGMWNGDVVAAGLPGWSVSGYASRALSDEGRLFFNSTDELVPRDVNDNWDVYEYEPAGAGSCGEGSDSGSVVFEPAHRFVGEKLSGEGGAGCVGLISSGTSAEESGFVDASESGGDVFFLTAVKLVGEDRDTVYDIYDARECTSTSPCSPASGEAPPPCETADACRAAPSPQPEVFGAPASSTFSGPGDVSSPAPVAVKVTKKRTVKCPRGKTRNKHGQCVKHKRMKAKAKRSAHTDRRTKR